MFMNIIGCYMVVVQMSAPLVMSPTTLMGQVNTCMVITEEVYNQEDTDLLSLYLALAWQESRFTMDAKGKWLCTGKGKLTIHRGKPRCSEGKLTRAMGPMQILPVYHCKGKPECNYVQESVRLLSRLTAKYGISRGLEIYAGGFSGSTASKRYARMTLSHGRKIDKVLDGVDESLIFRLTRVSFEPQSD